MRIAFIKQQIMLSQSSAYLPQAHPLPLSNTPLFSRLALLLLHKWNGSLAPLRNVPFSSSSASTLEGAPQSRLRDQHQHLWVNIQYSVELCVCVCGKVKVVQAPFYYANQNG